MLVLTDVQGSTRLWQDEPVAMDAAMTRHHEIVHGAVAEHGGWRPVDQGEGDAVFAAFRSPTAAVAAVVQVQRDLDAEAWPTSVPLRVRIGVHLGEVTERGGNLFGDPVNRCARLRGLGHGGQTLLSAPVYELVRDKLPGCLGDRPGRAPHARSTRPRGPRRCWRSAGRRRRRRCSTAWYVRCCGPRLG